MDCHEAEHLCDRYLDREITLPEYRDFRHHLQACPRCADSWAATRKAVDLLAALPKVEPGPRVLSRIMMTLPQGRRRRRSVRLSAWQAAAAVLLILAVTGGSFLTGSRQMIAAAVENREGQTVVIPQPGRPLVIPPGVTIAGDLRVNGDVDLQGQVRGQIRASGRVRQICEAGGVLGAFSRGLSLVAGEPWPVNGHPAMVLEPEHLENRFIVETPGKRNRQR